MKKLRHLARKILLATLFISFGLTSSILIADSNVGTLTNANRSQIEARYLPETAYNTPGYFPLELTITNSGEEVIHIAPESLEMRSATANEMYKLCKSHKKRWSPSKKAFVISSCLTGTYCALGLLGLSVTSMSHASTTELIFGIPAALGIGFALGAVIGFPISLAVSALFKSGTKRKTSSLNVRKVKKQFLRLSQDAHIAPNESQTLTYFVKPEQKKGTFNFRIKQGTQHHNIIVHA